MDKELLRLYFVTNRGDQKIEKYTEEVIIPAVEGGVAIVQLREKNLDIAEYTRYAKHLKEALKPYNVPLIINDKVDVCLAAEADGLHLGQEDGDYEHARQVLGPSAIIGLSVETMEQLMKANLSNSLSYVAASPVFETNTKADCKEAVGLEGLKSFCEVSRYPVVAIGGINRDNIEAVMQAGAAGAAVVSAISNAPSPEAAACELLELIKPIIGE